MNTESTSPGHVFPPKVYPSKRDIWFIGATWLFLVIGLGWPFIVWPDFLSDPLAIILPSLILIFIAIDLPIVLNTYYVLEDDQLLIRSGWFRSRINYSDIEEVRPSRPLVRLKSSRAALSRDSLLIRHRWASSSMDLSPEIDISPEDKEGFMRDLASRSPDLTYRVTSKGGQVVRIDKGGQVVRINKAEPGTTRRSG